MDWYELLGVPEDADETVIRRAYRRAALLYHPDKNPDPAAVETFAQLTEALEVLVTPDKRKQYDTDRATQKQQHRAAAQAKEDVESVRANLEKMKADLRFRESQAERGMSTEQVRRLEQLKMEGLGRRRQLDAERGSNLSRLNTNPGGCTMYVAGHVDISGIETKINGPVAKSTRQTSDNGSELDYDTPQHARQALDSAMVFQEYRARLLSSSREPFTDGYELNTLSKLEAATLARLQTRLGRPPQNATQNPTQSNEP